jgi:perosamine synthetase
VIAVDLYGQTADYEPIAAFCARHGVPLIEDAAEALGATLDGKPVGAIGDVACHSLYANKVITTGEGGMLTTNDAQLQQRARWKSNMCFGPDPETRFVHEELGYNYRLSSAQAAIGVAQLEHLDAAVQRKTEIAERYDRLLANVDGITRPPAAAWVRNVYWAYGILVNEREFGRSRAEVQRFLDGAGVETRRMFTPVHQQPFLDLHLRDENFPMSLQLAREGILLPSFVDMTDAMVDRVVQAIDDSRQPRRSSVK